MAPRTILHTGTSGAGTTSVALATARRCAAAGQRTLVLCVHPGGGLAEALGVTLRAEPVQVVECLWAQRVSPRPELAQSWGTVRAGLGGLPAGYERVAARALTLAPGLPELLAFPVLVDVHAAGAWDVVVVDCPPPAAMLRIVALADLARWWLLHVLPQPDGLLDAMRRLGRAELGPESGGESALEGVGLLARRLIALEEILRDAELTSVRLVARPDGADLEESRRTLARFGLHGLAVDAVVVNRVLPAEVGDYFGPWRARQQQRLVAVDERFAPVRVLRAPHLAEEAVGPAMLDRLGDAVFASLDAAGVLHHPPVSPELVLGRDGATLRLHLPFAERDGLALKRAGGELLVELDGHQRTLPLPPALADYRASGARFEDSWLLVAFDPPP